MAKNKKRENIIIFCDHPECKNESVWECLHIQYDKKRNIKMCDLHAIELMFKLRDARIAMLSEKEDSPIKTV